jgi:hypothetical protein
MRFTTLLKSLDLFSHEISLDFDGKGNKFPTTTGGLASLAIKSYICFYVMMLLKKMFLLEGDNLISVTSLKTPEDTLKDLLFNETETLPYFAMTHYKRGPIGYPGDTETERHIKLRAYQYEHDTKKYANSTDKKDVYGNLKEVKSRICQRSDFYKDENDTDNLKIWD